MRLGGTGKARAMLVVDSEAPQAHSDFFCFSAKSDPKVGFLLDLTLTFRGSDCVGLLHAVSRPHVDTTFPKQALALSSHS